MQQVARAVEIELKRIKGTRDVATIGGPGHVIRVVMDADRMNAYGVTAQDLEAALQVSNASQPAGSLVSGNQELLVQTGTYIETAADVKKLVVGVSDNKPVFMADVAQIVDGADQPSRYVWHGTGAARAAATAATRRPKDLGEFPAVTLSISKKPGVNAADVAEAVIRRAESLKGTVIPDGVEFTRHPQLRRDRDRQGAEADRQARLRHRLRRAAGAACAGQARGGDRRRGGDADAGGDAVRLLGMGLHPQPRLAVRPHLLHRHPGGRRHCRGREHPPLAGAGAGASRCGEIIPRAVDEVGGPTILATFTVIAALLPMAFVSGLMGPYMSPIPINASMGMSISLAIAFVITPWLSLVMMGRHHAGGTAHESDKLTQRLQQWCAAPHDAFHRRADGQARAAQAVARASWPRSWPRCRWPVFKLVVLKMLPFDNKSEFQIVLDMPVGTPLEETAKVLREISAYVATVPEVTDYQAYAGTAAPINFNGLVRQYYLRASPELGDIQVNLVDKHQRDRKSHEIAAGVRDGVTRIAQKHGGNAKVVEVPPGPPVLSPIVAEIYGPDYPGQQAVAKTVAEKFRATDDIISVDDSVDEAAPKILLRVNQSKAALLGVAQKDIVDVVRLGLAGENVTPAHTGESKYEMPVRVTLPAEKQSSLDQLLKMRVRARDGQLIQISELVEARDVQREQVIYHKDLLPVVYVVGDMGGHIDSPLYGMFDIRSRVRDMALEQGGTLGEYFIRQPRDPYAGYSLKWDGEWQVTYETFRDMGIAYAVGLLLIYLLVVAQFKSYLVPLIIMAPIPLTVIGVMPGHALFGAQFTATSMIGMIALAGIIVRNSILLVDFINAQVATGMPFAQAVVESAAIRAKPIALTGLAAMLGALFILDDPIFQGLAISLIFGIFVSTLLTLVVIPVLYYAAMRGRMAAPSEG